jgi:hypothetical protein
MFDATTPTCFFLFAVFAVLVTLVLCCYYRATRLVILVRKKHPLDNIFVMG